MRSELPSPLCIDFDSRPANMVVSRVIRYLRQNGFYKEGEVTFPHKQSAVMKIKRDSWECPAI